MYCVKCGTELLPDAKFCTSCGVEATDLRNTGETAEVPKHTTPTSFGPQVIPPPAFTSSALGDQNSDLVRKQKLGIIIAVALILGVLFLHNPTAGYTTKITTCDKAAVMAQGGFYKPTPSLFGGLTDAEADKIAASIVHCLDYTGKSHEYTVELGIFDYESNGAMLEPLRKISGLLFGSALICVLLVVWLRLYGKK